MTWYLYHLKNSLEIHYTNTFHFTYYKTITQFFAKFCIKFVTFLNVFFTFLHKKCWKLLFQSAFGCCTPQTLFEIYNTHMKIFLIAPKVGFYIGFIFTYICMIALYQLLMFTLYHPLSTLIFSTSCIHHPMAQHFWQTQCSWSSSAFSGASFIKLYQHAFYFHELISLSHHVKENNKTAVRPM